MDIGLGLVLVIVVLVVVFWIFLRDDSSAAPSLTPQTPTTEELQKIERLALLNAFDPELAYQLAQRLSPTAKPLILVQVIGALFNAGRTDRAMTILNELSPPHRDVALGDMLSSLFAQKQPQAALDLLKHNAQHEALPLILAVQVAQARGDSTQTQRLIMELSALSEESRSQTLSGPDNRLLASLQHASGLEAAAAISLQYAWAWVVHYQPLPDELRAVLLEYLAQGRIQEIPGLGSQLQPAGLATAGAVLLEAGYPEPAFAWLTQAGASATNQDYARLMDSLLQKNHSDIALRLLACAPSEISDHLLLSLLLWHAAQGSSAQAQALLDSQQQAPEQRFNLLLNLWANIDAQAAWRTSLFEQAMAELEKLRGQDAWPWCRMSALEIQLQVQAGLPAQQRDSWLVSNSLEELTRLSEQIDTSDRLDKYRVQARLLHELGHTAQAEQLLDKALKLLEELDDPEIGEDLNSYHRAFIACSYLSLGNSEKAEALYALLGSNAFAREPLERDLLNSHIEQARLEEAVEMLTLDNMCTQSNPLPRLHEALDSLHSGAPERIVELKKRLLDKLDSDPFWKELPQFN